LLQHRVFLLRSAFSQQGEEEEGEQEQQDAAPGQGSPAGGSPGQDCPDQGSPSAPPVVAQEKGTGKQQREGTPRPLLPPCLIHPRKRPRPAAPSTSDSALTGDEPISDSEI
ncbi:BRF2 factor, partial [Neodrepanis coruscans]|nr:BRF2 factor [Neodrepanis coruscans]